MRILIDEYTGEPYDADKWYRGANACWVNKDAERNYLDAVMKAGERRRENRNLNRIAKGKKRKPPSKFRKAAERYHRYLMEDGGETFGEWLKLQRNRRFECM